MKRKTVFTLIIVIMLSWLYSSIVFAIVPERRRDQFQNTPGFLALPLFYSFPGIGQGLFVVGSANNIAGSSADVLGLVFGGDAEGYFGTVEEFFFIPEALPLTDNLYFTAVSGTAAKVGFNVYASRGMDNEKEDFNIFVGKDFNFRSVDFVFTFNERRVELAFGQNDQNGKFIEIKDFKGEEIPGGDLSSDPIIIEGSQTHFQAKIDLTDDYNDPRDGLHIRLIQENFPAIDDDDPSYDTRTIALTYYLPILDKSTWAFHYFRSDAIVSKEGNTDLASLKTANGFSACGGNSECEAAVTNSAQNQLNANKNGTSRGLGGSDRLRSYPMNRYQAAHTQMFGTEFRWNFSTEKTKLDFIFLKDIQDSLQAVFFFEQGSVVEEEADLGSIVRSSYGGGVRVVTQSGAVYKAEIATGDEGGEFIVFFEYPWVGIFGS